MSKRGAPKIDLDKLDPGIRRYVKVLRDAGIFTSQSCQGRNKPGHYPERDGEHSGDWPYITFNGWAADAYRAVGIAMYERLPVRSIEQSWFVSPDNPHVLMGPDWRITFWEKDEPE